MGQLIEEIREVLYTKMSRFCNVKPKMHLRGTANFYTERQRLEPIAFLVGMQLSFLLRYQPSYILLSCMFKTMTLLW